RPPTSLVAPAISTAWLPVVGVVGDVRNDGLSNPVAPAIYVPCTFNVPPWTQILVRSQTPPLNLLRAVKLQLASVNADQQAYSTVEDLETWIENTPTGSRSIWPPGSSAFSPCWRWL